MTLRGKRRAVVVAVLYSLLAFTASAHAGSAWVLWS
jgi:hypothetical protein